MQKGPLTVKQLREIEERCNNDADLISHARTDIPLLLDEIRELRMALYEIAQSPYPLHDYCSKESWEFACNLVASVNSEVFNEHS